MSSHPLPSVVLGILVLALTGASGADRFPSRETAAQRLEWGATPAGEDFEHVRIIALNDFHGALSGGQWVEGRPVGGAAVLTAWVRAAQREREDRSLIVHAGDLVGASPAASGLLQDEPTISWLNQLANPHCDTLSLMDPLCNLVGTLGNHEFDEGVSEMMRLIYGGEHRGGPYLDGPWLGARFPYICANAVHADTGELLLPAYVIKRIGDVRVGFVGAVLRSTPSIVIPAGVAGVRFLDETESINRAVEELRAQDVRAIVVLLHQGGRQASDSGAVHGAIHTIVERLDDEVDVIVSGHLHGYTKALMANSNGREILVTQAFAHGTAFAEIDLRIDRSTGDVAAKSAAIVTPWADAGPGLVPDRVAAALVDAAERAVAPRARAVITISGENITRYKSRAGESALGNLVADAQRAAMGTDFSFMNPGGLRTDLREGPLTWEGLFALQPFGNSLVRMELTGDQVYTLLEQQWSEPKSPRMLQISGLGYTWDAKRPYGQRVVEVRKNGRPIRRTGRYTVTVNSFLADGGDGFTVLAEGVERGGGPLDLDALIAYVRSRPRPLLSAIEGRIERVRDDQRRDGPRSAALESPGSAAQ